MKKLFALYPLMVLLALPALAFAVDNFVTQVISKVLTMLVWPLFVGAVVIMSVWAGFLYLTAHGEPEKIKTANKAVIFIVIGIIVAILIGGKLLGLTGAMLAIPVVTVISVISSEYFYGAKARNGTSDSPN